MTSEHRGSRRAGEKEAGKQSSVIEDWPSNL